MDTLLYDGDHYLDARGVPVAVEGDRALIQSALIRLQVKRGSFSLDPELGSELYRLRRSDSDANNRIALSYVQEALAPLPEIAVRSVTCRLEEPDGLAVEVAMAVEGVYYQLEVEVEE